jgi:hypothetical protein
MKRSERNQMIKTVSLGLLALASALVLGVSAAGASTSASPPTGIAAYRACLKAHGVTFGGATQPSAAKMKAAFAACASKAPGGAGARGPNGFRPNGFRSPAFQKYTACLRQHGLTFTPGTRPNRNSAAFKAASKSCASLRPKGRRAAPKG